MSNKYCLLKGTDEDIIKKDEIIFNRELSIMYNFVLDFTDMLVKNDIIHVIVSGYVAILFGRYRLSQTLRQHTQPQQSCGV